METSRLITVAALSCAACSYDWGALSAQHGDGGAGGGADAGPCEFMLASNIDPCALDAATFNWRITDNVTINLDLDETGVLVEQSGGLDAWVIHARSFIIEPGGSLLVMGALPLIVVVDGVIRLDGIITVVNGADGEDCQPGRPEAGGWGDDQCGGGGGGGAFQADGGDGRGCPDGTAADDVFLGGEVSPDTDLEPLRGGCSGAAGGKFDTPEIDVALGGPGGGAIQLIAGESIVMGAGGGIMAVGLGGEGGLAGDKNEVSGGGGGGGSGGGVLLEAPVLMLDGGVVCATGGGGGSGGDAAGSSDGEPGEWGDCSDDPATGGDATGTAGAGGDGGTTGSLAGTSGSPATTALGSGGGGGGAAGVIRIRTVGPLVPPDGWHPAATVD